VFEQKPESAVKHCSTMCVPRHTWPPAKAAREFQEIANHRGITMGDVFGVLAHLGLARAYAIQASDQTFMGLRVFRQVIRKEFQSDEAAEFFLDDAVMGDGPADERVGGHKW
jgi:hypothetical protein